MDNLINTISQYTTAKEMYEAKNIYIRLKNIVSEELFAIVLLYRLGIAEGKRMERDRRAKRLH